VAGKYDLGIAFDGDADRCLLVDEQGGIIDGDKVMAVCGAALREKGELSGNTIVATVMSNLGLYRALDEAGIGYEKTAVGDRYVYERMADGGFSLGGEQSGHIILSKYATTGDGILTSIMLAEALVESGGKASKLSDNFSLYPQILENVRVRDPERVLRSQNVQDTVESVKKTLGDSGRVLVRKSGTEPLIRVMVESKSYGLCRECTCKIVSQIKTAANSRE
jgi:phosphoglucosamine mutase